MLREVHSLEYAEGPMRNIGDNLYDLQRMIQLYEK